ncbi:MAG: hypothetical protein K6A41_06635 [Bacteroidales bacterium]|nr:hypothetical protein [Bacteroidales bacterium]
MTEKKDRRTHYQHKIEDIYHFYMTHGFDHSVEDIAMLMGISKKTFFNRYVSKLNSIKLSFDMWMRNLSEHINERLALCNNVAESLIILVVEFKKLAEEKSFFYQHAMKLNIMMDVKVPFPRIIIEVLQEGKRHYQVREDLNITAYTDFFLFNLIHYISYREIDGDLIRHLLMPALNERGLEQMEFAINSLENR